MKRSDKRQAMSLQMEISELTPVINDEHQVISFFPEKEERLESSIVAPGYLPIRQGRCLNLFFHTYMGNKLQTNLNGDLIIPKQDLEIIIKEFAGGVSITAKLLLDALILQITEKGCRDTQISLPLKRYMEWRRLQNIVSARWQVTCDLKALQSIEITCKEKVNGKKQTFRGIRIEKAKLSKGMIEVTISESFLELLKGYSVMYYPLEILGFKTLYNRNSPYLLKKLTVHQRMNQGKSNENIISVKTVLGALPEMLRYEDIRERGQVTKLIIRPFERDMNALKTIEWRYYGRNGTEIERPQNYHEIIEANIFFTLKGNSRKGYLQVI